MAGAADSKDPSIEGARAPRTASPEAPADHPSPCPEGLPRPPGPLPHGAATAGRMTRSAPWAHSSTPRTDPRGPYGAGFGTEPGPGSCEVRRPQSPVGRGGAGDGHRARGDLARRRHRTPTHPPTTRLPPTQPGAAEETRPAWRRGGHHPGPEAGAERHEDRDRGGGRGGAEAFPRGLAALARYIEREQKTVIPRQHPERITIEGQEHDVRLEVWLSNQTSRRDKLGVPVVGLFSGPRCG